MLLRETILPQIAQHDLWYIRLLFCIQSVLRNVWERNCRTHCRSITWRPLQLGMFRRGENSGICPWCSLRKLNLSSDLDLYFLMVDSKHQHPPFHRPSLYYWRCGLLLHGAIVPRNVRDCIFWRYYDLLRNSLVYLPIGRQFTYFHLGRTSSCPLVHFRWLQGPTGTT